MRRQQDRSWRLIACLAVGLACWWMVAVAEVWASEPTEKATKSPTVPALPEAFSSFGAAVCDGYVYVYGGHTGKTHTYSTEAVTGKFRRLKLAEPEKGWEELPADLPLQGLALAAHAGKLYRIGGMQPRNPPGEKADLRSVKVCACFDPGTNQWQPLPDLPAPRSSHDAIFVGSKLVVIGGWALNRDDQGRGAVWHDTALILDTSKEPLQWQAIPQPFKRRALTVGTLGDKVYVVGGLTDEGELDQTVNVLDLATNTWSEAPEIPGKRRNGFTPATCVMDGRLYISPADGKVYRLNKDGDDWDEVGKLTIPRFVHRMVPFGGGRLLVLNGASPNGNVREAEVIAPRQP